MPRYRECRVATGTALSPRYRNFHTDNQIGGIMSEVAAYGTAVTVEPQSASDTAVVAEG
jgi:hypothetical protein